MPQVAYLRAYVFEDLPATQYPDPNASQPNSVPPTALTFLGKLSGFDPAAVTDLTTNLSNSLAYQIETTTSLYDNATVTKCFLTLFRMRDFILNAGLAAGRTNETWYADLAAYPHDGPSNTINVSTDLQQLTNDLKTCSDRLHRHTNPSTAQLHRCKPR
jgi:hypothetical protein